jgi:putative hydrolase of the HAD superfamily
MTKPEEQFFSYMLSETGFSPDETLFIDDSPDNCEAARRMGIRYINLTDRKMLSELLHTVR